MLSVNHSTEHVSSSPIHFRTEKQNMKPETKKLPLTGQERPSEIVIPLYWTDELDRLKNNGQTRGRGN